jgi:hypothetical protein
MFGVIANVKSDRQLRTGAKVWIVYCKEDTKIPIVRGLSKHGKIITKYCHYKRLKNYRAAYIPEHLLKKVDRFYFKWESKDIAIARARDLNVIWSGIRRFSRDGSKLLEAGAPNSYGIKKALSINTAAQVHFTEKRVCSTPESSTNLLFRYWKCWFKKKK